MKTLIFLFFNLSIFAKADPLPLWNVKLQSETMRLIKTFNAEMGVFVKDTKTGFTYSMNADTPWYLASSIKIFIAAETFRRVKESRLALTDLVTIETVHYRDGAGKVNWLAPGQKVTIGFLLEEMMIESDNAATDLLLDFLGVDKVNAMIQTVTPEIGPIVSMLDVRRRIYSQIHEKGEGLTNMDFIELKKINHSQKKLVALAKILKVSPKEFRVNLEQAFNLFYETGVNTGTLRGMGTALEKLATRDLISPDIAAPLMDLMLRCETGKDRIRGGLPDDIQWAHKTGTQHQRICDMGVAADRYVIVVCIKNYKTPKGADIALKNFGKLFSKTVLGIK